ncbi:hypothetical protein [Streptomyces sp. JNUCC 63]
MTVGEECPGHRAGFLVRRREGRTRRTVSHVPSGRPSRMFRPVGSAIR